MMYRGACVFTHAHIKLRCTSSVHSWRKCVCVLCRKSGRLTPGRGKTGVMYTVCYKDTLFCVSVLFRAIGFIDFSVESTENTLLLLQSSALARFLSQTALRCGGAGRCVSFGHAENHPHPEPLTPPLSPNSLKTY